MRAARTSVYHCYEYTNVYAEFSAKRIMFRFDCVKYFGFKKDFWAPFSLFPAPLSRMRFLPA